MKTTEDEKKIIEMYHTTVHQLKKYRNSFVELNKLVDDYLRTLKGSAAVGVQLGDLFARIATEQNSVDIEDLFTTFGHDFRAAEEKRELQARAFFDEIFNPIRKYLNGDKQTIESLVANVSKKTREAKLATKKAEAKSKKFAKDGAKLQTAISELNSALQEAQKVHMDSLRSALIIQRGKYCSVAAHMGVVFDRLAEYHEAEQKILTNYREKMKLLGKQTKNIGSDLSELCKRKIRTLIDITKLSTTWKTIFKAAGVKKSDLRDAETAKYILKTIEEATGQKIDMGGVNFDDYDDDTEVPPPPPPPRHIPPPPPRDAKPAPSRTEDMSSLSQGGDYQQQEEEEEEEEQIDYEYVPPAPAPPPPGQLGGGAPAVPSGRAGLLSQIQQGTTLRRVERAPAELPEVENANDITSILKNAMAARRPAVVDDQDEGDDDDEWSD